MTDIDLTGWTLHNGGPAPDTGDEPLRVVLRGKQSTGPCESGPSPASAMNWGIALKEHLVGEPVPKVITMDTLYPAGEIVGWIREADLPTHPTTEMKRYPHVRADMGR